MKVKKQQQRKAFSVLALLVVALITVLAFWRFGLSYRDERNYVPTEEVVARSEQVHIPATENHSETPEITSITQALADPMPTEIISYGTYDELPTDGTISSSEDFPIEDLSRVDANYSGEETASVGGDFILPHSSTSALTDSDLNGLSAHQLMIARNEIFARHGRQFFDQSIQDHFDAQSWYQPTLSLGVEPTLMPLEQLNVALIQVHEEGRTVGGSVSAGGDFILPHSSTSALTDVDLNGLSVHQLMIARNEIYARHGRRFFDASIQNHFDAQSWYQPQLPLGVEPTLTSLELSNVAFIQAHEARR